MKHLSHRILFSPAVLTARFSTSSFSGAHHHHDEVWRNVRVCVWWDFENCHMPSGVNVFKVGHAITSALRANGIRGPVQITAFGDVLQLSRTNQEALSATGINLNHIPTGGKNSSDRSLLVDLMYWVSQNPPPAHLFLISGDRDFANILHRLRMSNYNILLATKSNAPGVLCSAASIMWNWNSLLKMEKLKGTHFNQPPDGSYGSWYGHSKVPLEDPFALIEQPTCLTRENLTAFSSELQGRPIPCGVQRQIRDMLNLHPDGIPISAFSQELKKSDIILDKDLYGHKKLSYFLLAMPNVLELQAMGDGQYMIHGINAKGLEPFVPNQSSVTRNQQLIKSSKSNGKDASISQPVDVKSSLPPSSKDQLKEIEKYRSPPVTEEAAKVDSKPLQRAEQPSLVGENVDLANVQLTDSGSVNVKDGTSEVGSFKKLLQKILYGEGVDISEIKSSDIAKEVQISGDNSDQRTLAVREKCITSGDSAGNEVKVNDFKSQSTSEVGSFKKLLQKILYGEGVAITEIKSSDIAKEVQICGDNSDQITLAVREKCITSGDSADSEVKVNDFKSPSKGSDSVKPATCSKSSVEPILEKDTAFDSNVYNKKTGKSLGLFIRVLNWFKFKSSESNSQRSSDKPSPDLEHTNSSSRTHQVFAKVSFWKDLESFMDTKNALLVISQSTTRQQMAQNLRKEGPLVLRTLKESDMLELIDMLISDKKWVEECPSEASPFKLTRCVGSHTSSTGSPSNGLRSLFLSEQAQPNLKTGDKRIQNVSHAGVTGRFVATNRTHLGRTKKEVLNDCHKLANEIVEEFPKGYSIGSFRKLFLEKYGYDLDIRKLGYNKLACLLQTIPGLKIESSIIIPASKALKSEGQGTAVSDCITSHKIRDSDCELSDLSEKDEEPDAVWDELGPIAKIGSKRNKMESSLREMVRKDIRQLIHADYEPLLSDDDDLSDSDSEYKVPTQKREQAKLESETTEDSSSLLKLLHSYDDDQEDDKTRGKSEDVQGEADTDINCLEPWNPCGRGTKLGKFSGKYVVKHKPQKYSFVADAGGSTAEKLLETGDEADKMLNILSTIRKQV